MATTYLQLSNDKKSELIKNELIKFEPQKQHSKNRLTARERIDYLIDPNTEFLELCRFAAYGMYKEFGGANCAGIKGSLFCFF